MEPTVIVTGAGSGIGYHLTCGLLEHGYRIAGLDINTTELLKIEAQFPGKLLIYTCDVTDIDQVRGTVRKVVNAWQHIDILVNNACLCLYSRFEEKDLADTRREFEVNFFGYINTILIVTDYMKQRGRGSIWNVSFGVGISGFPGLYGYASTKGAIEALTRTLAIEFESYGIHVGLFHPPLTRTRSSELLGLPDQVMAEARIVGRQLSKKVESTSFVVAPDFKTSLSLRFLRWFPRIAGRMIGRFASSLDNPKPHINSIK